jgi:hypothetical protein
MTMTNEQLHEKAKDPRLAKQPAWVQQLVAVLDVRLRSAEASRLRTAEKAAEEVDAARALLNEGPADSDTFLWLSTSAVSDGGWGDDPGKDVRPLGHGVTVEFRDADSGPAEGFEVKMKDGQLEVSGINVLYVKPQAPNTVRIGRS